MKKLIVMMLFLVGLVANATMIDGSYSVEKKQGGKWKAFAKIVVKGNRIIGVQYDKKDSTGNLLSLNQQENEKYKAEHGETFRDASFKMTRKLTSTQSLDKLEEIKDETTFQEFKELIEYLLDKANKGEAGDYKL